VPDQPEFVKKLEERVQALRRDRQLSTPAVDGGEADRSPLAGYEAITKDPNVTIGVRYLALHCIASKQSLYRNPRDPAQMLGVMSDEMGKVPLPEVVRSIQNIRLNYDHVYQVDPTFFDRAETNAKELMSRLPEDLQGQTVDRAKGTNLKPIPIAAEPPPVTLQPAPTYVATPIPEKAPAAPPYTPIPIASQIHTSGELLATTVNQPVPSPNNNKGALIISGSLIAGAMVFSASLLSSQNRQTTSDSLNLATPIASNGVSQSASLSTQSQSPISQAEAKNLVARWLQAKITMFAPPYDQQIGTQLATGKTYSDKVRGPSTDGTSTSSLEWLRQYGFYYKYGVQNIEGITRFESSGDLAVIEVQMLEDARLYDKRGNIQPDRSGIERKIVRFMLKRENGTLKISDYGTIGTSKRQS
jgi:hypothetical protein